MHKCVDIIVGLQFGSEGKGKIAALMAKDYRASVRVGAPNAGHTIIHKNQVHKMRTIPCAWINEQCALYIGAGGLINMDVLRQELESLPIDVATRLSIDINAGIVTHEDIEAEERAKMYEGIGSTCEGIGEAAARKVLRRSGGALTAKNVKELQPFLSDVSYKLNECVNNNVPVLVEGTQGFGLSLNHGYYPYVTSRDVLASSMLSECGLAPQTVRRVIGVMRTYPIRVHGNSGPMGAEELTWEQVAKESGYESLVEKTTVTGRVRRVSRLNMDLLQAAIRANRPTEIALMFADYINSADRNINQWTQLSSKTRRYISELEQKLAVPVTMISTGPLPEDTVFTTDADLVEAKA